MAVRYFPVSQDINRDPEIHELCKRFGTTGLRAWLECLSIADRNNGELPGAWSAYPSILAGACQSTTRHLRGICEWFTSHLRDGCEMPTRWLVVDSEGIARVRNYPKYHKLRAERGLAPNLPNHSSPNLLKIKSPESAPPDSLKPNGLDKEKKSKQLDAVIKVWADRIYQTDVVKYARLVQWIKAAERYYTPVVIATALERYLPYAASVVEWWPYLDKILDKEEAKRNARNEEEENDRRKREPVPSALAQLVSGITSKPH